MFLTTKSSLTGQLGLHDVDNGADIGPSVVSSATRVQAPCHLVHGFLTSQQIVATSPSFPAPSTSTARDYHSRSFHGSPMTMSKRFASLSVSMENHDSKDKQIEREYQDSQQRLSFDDLPREIKVHIFRYLIVFQLVRVSRVNENNKKPVLFRLQWSLYPY